MDVAFGNGVLLLRRRAGQGNFGEVSTSHFGRTGEETVQEYYRQCRCLWDIQ